MSLPTHIAKYEIVGRLAAGGMAEILLARLTGPSGFERAVVVKRILPHLAAETSFRSMFLDEARIVARIRHPNVVQVQELGQDGEELYLAMEYLEGESCSAIMRRLHATNKPLDRALAAYIVAQACAGLNAAHDLRTADGQPLNLVHRDVSPQNVFVTYGGEIKILDFGIAKAADSSSKTETGTFKGKFEYASPEQFLGHTIDRRSDIFAMGVILFELTTGRRLFRRDSQLLTMRAICRGEVPPDDALPGDYPPALARVWRRALAPKADARYATAAEMRRELLTVGRDLGLDPEPEAALARLMQSLFEDRISLKEDLLRRVRVGTEVGPLPPNESDPQVEIPVVEATLRATATLETTTTPMTETGGRRALGLGLGAIAVVIGGVGISTLVSRGDPIRPAETLAPATAALAAPLSSTVVLTIETMPSEVEVIVAGRSRGASPAKVEVDRSSEPLAIELRRDGFTSRTERIVPNVDQKISFGLTPVTSASASPPPPKPAPARSTRSRPAAPAPKPSAPAEPFRRFE